MRQMNFKAVVIHIEIETAKARTLLHLAENRATRLALHPNAVAEGIRIFKRNHRAEVQVHLAIELQRFAEPAFDKLRLVVPHELHVRVTRLG